MITSLSNEMERTFSWVMEWMRAFLHEMDEAKNMDFFVSGRGQGVVISTFSNEMENGFSWAMGCMRTF